MKTVPKNRRKFLARYRSSQSGYNLIEVMIASFLLSFAVLGVAGLQVIGMKGTSQSLMKQQAMGLVQNLTERIRANSGVLSAYQFDSDNNFNCSTALPDCSSLNCTALQIAQVDKHNLVCGYGTSSKTSALKATSTADTVSLINGSLKVECVPAGNCATRDIRITVGWTEREIGTETIQMQQSTGKSDSLVLTTRIAAP